MALFLLDQSKMDTEKICAAKNAQTLDCTLLEMLDNIKDKLEKIDNDSNKILIELSLEENLPLLDILNNEIQYRKKFLKIIVDSIEDNRKITMKFRIIVIN